MYTIDDFKNGKVIIDNNNSRNPSKVREILDLLFPSGCKASGNGNYYVVDSVLKDWVANSNIKSFEELPVQSINDFEIPNCFQKLSIGDTYNFEGQHRIISELGQHDVYFAKDIKGNPRDSFKELVFFKKIKEDPRYTNYKSILLTNNNNQNEKTGKTSTVNSGQRTESGISSSSTRQIASASRLVGDSTQSKCKKTRIGRIEISRNAISF